MLFWSYKWEGTSEKFQTVTILKHLNKILTIQQYQLKQFLWNLKICNFVICKTILILNQLVTQRVGVEKPTFCVWRTYGTRARGGTKTNFVDTLPIKGNFVLLYYLQAEMFCFCNYNVLQYEYEYKSSIKRSDANRPLNINTTYIENVFYTFFCFFKDSFHGSYLNDNY